ncbi:DUF4329 domain-containing protein [Salibaculum sp.]|uniref:DUF4329 domain-containing protein n=1 Tax=Salibaculum sp. TaxID=2855480 RepID=UPI002B480923|nr:DUF4329 domain-containing protein [Salibaculum sp.]HKL70398.1 DUF4329 domain-containing protein [Salibaculum sp.]
MHIALPLLAFLALVACAAPAPTPPPDTPPRAPLSQVTPPEDARAGRFARAFLDAIQPRSVALRRELCGYFYVTEAGEIAATPPRVGDFAGCEMPVPRSGAGVFASYHTHSAFAPGYDNEVPSVRDLLNDVQLGIDGYVSTPGGRVWQVDHGTRSLVQLCGIGCVFMDPGFVPVGESAIRPRYSMSELRHRAATN